LDLLLPEQPVAAAGPLRRHEPLALEVADLRDRDVGELTLQPLADRADGEQPRALRCFGRRHCRNVSLYLPICSSSPSLSRAADSMRRRLRNVPLRLPRSSISRWSSLCATIAWRRDTVTSSRKMSQSGDRPIVVSAGLSGKVSPARPPPERT